MAQRGGNARGVARAEGGGKLRLLPLADARQSLPVSTLTRADPAVPVV